MTDELIPAPSDAALVRWQELEEAVRTYARASKAPNTVRAYRSDLGDFTMWCAEHHLGGPIPATPETVALYISALAGTGTTKASTIQRRLSSISQAHQLAGYEPSPTQAPLVRATMAGIRRTLGMALSQKSAVVTAELRTLLAVTPDDTLAGLRDHALLLVGFAGGFRRSELVALDVDDIDDTEDGLRIRVRRSKTDQESEGREVGIPRGQKPETDPVRALRVWRSTAGIATGPLFRPVNRHDQVQDRRLTAEGVSIRRATQGTRSAQGSRRLRQQVERQSGRSCGRRDTDPSKWCGVTFEPDRCSRKMQPPTWGCNGNSGTVQTRVHCR